MTKPKSGDTVYVHYTGHLLDGEQFDSSAGREPLAFTLGGGMVIPGFDAAVADLELGEKTTVTIPADEAYGPHSDELIQRVPRDFFGDELPEVGWVVQLQSPDGQVIAASIESIEDDEVALDLNHPLAGQDLVFDLELVDISDEPLVDGCGCGDENCDCGDAGCDCGDDDAADDNWAAGIPASSSFS